MSVASGGFFLSSFNRPWESPAPTKIGRNDETVRVVCHNALGLGFCANDSGVFSFSILIRGFIGLIVFGILHLQSVFQVERVLFKHGVILKKNEPAVTRAAGFLYKCILVTYGFWGHDN